MHVDATALAALALAKHQLGDVDQARASLDRARAILATKPAAAMRGFDWFDWLHSEILCREAERVVQRNIE
jgi:hypothetical protein